MSFMDTFVYEFFLDVHYIHFDLYEYTYKIHIFNTLELVYEF